MGRNDEVVATNSYNVPGAAGLAQKKNHEAW